MLYKIVIKSTVFILFLGLGGGAFASFSGNHSAHTLEKETTAFQGGLTLNGEISYARFVYVFK